MKMLNKIGQVLTSAAAGAIATIAALGNNNLINFGAVNPGNKGGYGYDNRRDDNYGRGSSITTSQPIEGSLISDGPTSGVSTAGGYNDPILDYNAKEAQKARDFQLYLSSNSHQLEVEDLKKAGLNPILSANNGATAYGAATGDASTSMDIARLNAATALKQSQINASAIVSSALLSNDAMKYSADKGTLNSFINGAFGLGRSAFLGK